MVDVKADAPSAQRDGLVVSDLVVSFGTVSVLRGVNLTAAPGEVIGLVGRNGAGKTTTLRTISGMNDRVSGSVRYQGVELPVSPASVVRSGVAHVPEGRQLMGHFTVLENLRFACYAAGRRLDDGVLDDLRQSFGVLDRIMNRRAGLLSGGEQQMVAIARGLAVSPSILLVDELSLGLSPRAVQESLTALIDACKRLGTTLILVDQNVRSIMKVCDRAYVLANGTTVEVERGEGEWEEMVAAAYLGSHEGGAAL